MPIAQSIFATAARSVWPVIVPSGAAAVLSGLSSYGVVAGTSGFTLTASGTDFQSGDQIELWGSNLSTTFVNSTTLTASVATGSLTARNFGCVRIARGAARSYPLPFEVYDTASYSNSYHTTASTTMGLTYGTAPAKGGSKTLDTAGTIVYRETDITDTPTAGNYTGTYSRYPNVSADGLYLLADRENSTSMALYRRSDRANLGAVRDGLGTGVNNDIGEFHEPRWDTLGNRPGVIYYMRGMALYERDIVAGTSQVLIRDFTADFGAGYLQNDVEGLCSLDCRFWVWGQRDSGLGSGIIRIVRYDRLTDTYTTANHTTLGITLSLGGGTRFSKPNMVESSIRGDRVITHYGRVYPGNRDSEFGTNADMPRSWAPDFTDPRVIAVDETHSGQAFDASMNQVYVSQSNRIDNIEWAPTVTGGLFRNVGSTLNSQTFPAAGGATGRTQMLDQAVDSGGYATSIGYHISSNLSGVRRGFTMVGSYSVDGAYPGTQQLRMYRLSDARVWKLGHKPGVYPSGDAYRNEAQPAMSHDCTEVIMGGNWNDLFSGAHREVFIAYLPRDWHTNAIWS